MLFLKIFSDIIELCDRYVLTQGDINQVGKLSEAFVEGFERLFFRYETDRLGLCKYTVHLVLHLRDNMERCGLVNCNQFWVERYLGFINNRLHAPTKAAESLANNAKLLDAYKLMFNKHFVRREVDFAPESEEESDSDEEGDSDITLVQEVVCLHPKRREKLSSNENTRLKLRELLQSYVEEFESPESKPSENVVIDEVFWSIGRLRVTTDKETITIGCLLSGRKRTAKSRADYFMAAGIEPDQCSLDTVTAGSVEHFYYGRVLKIVFFRFSVADVFKERCVVLAEFGLWFLG